MGRLKKVYAYQIKENKKYKGRYIILIKQPEIEGNNFSNLYKVKLTNDMKLPKTVEEINSCEFVKMRACPYELRMFPIMGDLNYDEALQNYKDATLPDSDNNLFNYDYSFIFTRKEKKSSLIYIGEFDVNDNPPYEKKTANHYTPAYGFISKLEKYTIKGYELNNKKTDFLYNERERKEYIQSRINFQNEVSVELKEWMANYNSQLYNYSFGYKLLDSDVTNMAINDYKKCYSKNKTSKEIIKDVMLEGKDCLNNKADSSLYIFGIAYEIMKHKREMPISFKKKVYSAVKKDLKYWTNNELYEKRKEELETFRNKVEKYENTVQ